MEHPRNTPQTLVVGNGAGFWGDNVDAPVHLVESGLLDVLTLEYLAELTLSILSHLRSKEPQAGYVTDFPALLGRLAPSLESGRELTIVTNAGGLNPPSCASACAEVLTGTAAKSVPIGVVVGDDILSRIPSWQREGVDLSHLETGESISEVMDRLVSANAYLGARPIAQALERGARIVLTGRVADASLTVGPACHAFGWKWDDWTKLAGASVAGHLIECGAQATGGLWHRWERMEDPAGIGYPFAELHSDGASVISKPPGSGGLVEVANVAEQLVYEIDDPRRYRTPDIDVDLTSVSLTQEGPNRVAVTGATGNPPSDRLKVAAVYRDGWTATGMLAVVGRDVAEKARHAGQLVLDRLRRAGAEPQQSLVECLGAGDVVCGVLASPNPPAEVVLRISVRDPDRRVVERFGQELAPLITSGPPGIAGYATGRPTPRPAFGYWPMLVPRDLVEREVRVEVRSASEWRAATAEGTVSHP